MCELVNILPLIFLNGSIIIYIRKRRREERSVKFLRTFAGIILCSAFAAAVCGCALETGESSRVHTSAPNEETDAESAPQTQAISEPAPATSLSSNDVIPDAVQTPRVEGDRLSYTIVNVYSDGDYYTVRISGVKMSDESSSPDIDMTYVKGVLYGDFRLDLMKKGEVIDSLKINVPRDDRFLILESVTESLSYGCELISNKREYSADEYPDLLQLDFYMINEVEIPQYARYFAIFDGKITEVPVYENGVEVAPRGTHPLMKSAGLMVQHLVVEVYNTDYTVKKYEYTFDVENRCLIRQEVKFYGWED